MTPRVLFIGGEKGSWEVRGRQIARALGGRVTVTPGRADWAWAEVVVLVKQAMALWGADARQAGLPIIWDVLDYWRQPEDNARVREAALLDVELCAVGLPRLIAATRAMADDIGGLYLPHHSRPGLVPVPPRTALRTVAYEGRVKYLGAWRPALEQACARLGARFVLNPRSLVQADVVVAFREVPWDGWACRQWKSGVKYVNALVAGRPIVTQPCAGFSEIGPVGTAIEDRGDLEAALREAWGQRAVAYRQGCRRASEFSLDAIAKQYRRLLQSALRRAA